MSDVSGGVDRLFQAVQELSMAKTLADVVEVVRVAARELTGADGATFVLRDGEMCFYVDENAISPLWRGQRFPLLTCISGWAMLNKETANIPDIYLDDRIPHDAYRPTFVQSLVMVPIRTLDPIGAIGNYWAEPHLATHTEVKLLESLANATCVALENVSIRAELAEKVSLENEFRRLSATDELTGLLNRRGFWEQSQIRLESLGEDDQALLAYLDLNGLKRLNDLLGHAAGDRALAAVSGALSNNAQPNDVLGRLGGDEFAALFIGADLDPDQIRDALDAQIKSVHPEGASIGLTWVKASEAESVQGLVARADALMYAEKQNSPSR